MSNRNIFTMAQNNMNELSAELNFETHSHNCIEENFKEFDNRIIRTIKCGSIENSTSLSFDETTKRSVNKYNLGLDAAFDLSWLKSATNPFINKDGNTQTINSVDLFCGIGGISLGIEHAAHALGLNSEILFANDISSAALEVFSRNLNSREFSEDPVENIFDGEVGEPLTNREKKIKAKLDRVDILAGGPPCQGHSDLNNHTRRDDPKNELYFRMARAAEVLKPSVVLIENVPGVRHDRNSVVERTEILLRRLGYNIQLLSVNALDFGVAQSRKRFFLLAYKNYSEMLDASHLRTKVRPLAWAIDDLKDKYNPLSLFDSSSNHSQENKRRIKYLFDNDIYELPDEERPDCHKNKAHSYKSVYGRMRWNEVSPTITGGFGSTGQGRFVHPLFQRTLTPHEAARVQFFPDFFDFHYDKRRELQQLIGNAVPCKIGYVIGLAIIPMIISSKEILTL